MIPNQIFIEQLVNFDLLGIGLNIIRPVDCGSETC